MALVKYDLSKLTNHTETMNTSVFVDRVYCFITEQGMNLNYGEYISKYYKNGMVRLLKSLELYKTIGRAQNRQVLIDERIAFVIDTSIGTSKTQAQSIIKLFNGFYSFDSFNTEPPEAYKNLQCGKAKKQIGNHATYLILNPENGLHKIGVSKNIYNRFSQLKRDVSPHIKIIGLAEKNHESELHYKYRQSRKFGEWFNLSTDDVLDIFNDYKFKEINP